MNEAGDTSISSSSIDHMNRTFRSVAITRQ